MTDIRVLLASEGPSEDIIGGQLIGSLFARATVDAKSFPARGIAVVKRSIETLVDAAHFGYYDLLVIQFDLDDTHDIRTSTDFRSSPRWADIASAIQTAQGKLRPIPRTRPFEVALMSGCQSTDGWLCWGRDGGDGADWERMNRHRCRELLYGKPAIGLYEKAAAYTRQLIERTAAEPATMPHSLRFFLNQLTDVRNKAAYW